MNAPKTAHPEPVEGLPFSLARQKGSAGLRQAQSKRRFFVSLCLCVSLLFPSTSLSAQSRLPEAEWANRQLPDPQQEAEAKTLMESLRCLVCQGQSIADSDADMAADMRAMVRRRIAAGEEPEDIRNWLVERYGRWVTYEPPFDAITWPLWLIPLLLLAIGGWLARSRFKRKSKEG
ncbi:MAG: cytochrome c-type biogenesis protein CcmH [Sphingomonadaceae bacterium]|nr:cytochrome c-type biogenesis protein CcmH [Sphingomonadaceae bacterium]